MRRPRHVAPTFGIGWACLVAALASASAAIVWVVLGI